MIYYSEINALKYFSMKNILLIYIQLCSLFCYSIEKLGDSIDELCKYYHASNLARMIFKNKFFTQHENVMTSTNGETTFWYNLYSR